MDFVVPLRFETNSSRYKSFFFLIEYKFRFNHGQGHVLEKQKMQQQQEQ